MSVRKALDRGGRGQPNVLEKSSNAFQLSISRGHVRQNRENQREQKNTGKRCIFQIKWDPKIRLMQEF